MHHPLPIAGRRGAGRHDPALRRLEAALHGVLETVEDAVFVCDPTGRITIANSAAVALFQDRPVGTFDELAARLVPPGAVAENRRPIEAGLRDRPSRRLEVRVADLDERRAGSGPAVPSRPEGRIVVVRDVTAERRERHIREAFLGMLSHELRTPITTVYAGSQVLARSDRLPAVVRRELAADVASEAERLYRLVEDLLALARLERGQLDLRHEPILLQRVVASVLRTEPGRWPRVEIGWSERPGVPAVEGDQRYVEQVIRNLVANAARYSPPAGRVDVMVEAADDDAVVRVVCGATPAPSGRTGPFDVADRSPESPADSAGAGIALLVCRRLVAAMDGRIWSGRTRDGGSEVGFALPRYRDADDRRLD